MTEGGIDWPRIRLVAFDVDGTLYAQRPLRLRMAARLIWHSLSRADSRTFAVLRAYRAHRERLGEAETERFEEVLVAEVARRRRVPEPEVRRIVSEWIDQRPLALLGRCRYDGIDTLFDRIRRSGRAIGVLSDYPARDKLEAMGLAADHIVNAGEAGFLKPHPRGLETLMRLAGTTPEETLLIGDRAERDGAAAKRAGVACLLRSDRPIPGWRSFSRFDDPVFDGIDPPRALAA